MKAMTKQEIRTWMRLAVWVDNDEYYDERGNCLSYDIFKEDGKLYRVDFCNDHPSEEWGEKGYVRGSYKPYQVEKHTRKIEVVEYIPVKS